MKPYNTKKQPCNSTPNQIKVSPNLTPLLKERACPAQVREAGVRSKIKSDSDKHLFLFRNINLGIQNCFYFRTTTTTAHAGSC